MRSELDKASLKNKNPASAGFFLDYPTPLCYIVLRAYEQESSKEDSI
jgi:hypothetical protein